MNDNLYVNRLCLAGSVYLGLLCFVHMLAFLPGGYTNITQAKYASFCAISALFAAPSVYVLIKERGENLVRERLRAEHIFAAMYAIMALVSAAFSDYPAAAFFGAHRLDGAISICVYCAVFVLLSMFYRRDRRVLAALVAGIVINCAVSALQLCGLNPLWLFPEGMNYYDYGVKFPAQFIGSCGNAGLNSSVLCLAAPILFICARRCRRRLRLPAYFAAVFALAILLLSKVSAAILGLALGITVCAPLVFGRTKRQKRRIAVISALIIIAALAVIYFTELPVATLSQLRSMLHGELRAEFGSGRIYIWENAIKLFPESPLLGGGPDTLVYRIGAHFTKTGPGGFSVTRDIDNAHNEYLNILVNQGLLGLGFYLAALAAPMIRFFRSKRKTPLATACAVGLICYLIQAFFGIGMCINSPYFWAALAILSSETAQSLPVEPKPPLSAPSSSETSTNSTLGIF